MAATQTNDLEKTPSLSHVDNASEAGSGLDKVGGPATMRHLSLSLSDQRETFGQGDLGGNGQGPVDPFVGQENSSANKRLLRKQDRLLIPACAIMYLLAYLDRSNIGNAKVMNSESGGDLMTENNLTEDQYAIALMVFLIAYTLFEVPSNNFLKRAGPSKWFSFLLVSWGTISMCLAATHNFAGLTVARFMLGIFEAGLAPGLAYYVSFWYRADERSIRLAFIYSTATLAGAFGGLIAYGISHMNEAAGLSGWRWCKAPLPEVPR